MIIARAVRASLYVARLVLLSTSTVADGGQVDMDFDVVVLGTGLSESIVAA